MARVVCTIGFAQKGLRRFVTLLREAGVTRLVDIRLHNTSQLAGFAKRDDLAFICELVGIGYRHLPELAPTELSALHRAGAGPVPPASGGRVLAPVRPFH